MNSENEESAGGRSGVICFKVPFFIINVITWVSVYVRSVFKPLSYKDNVRDLVYTNLRSPCLELY